MNENFEEMEFIPINVMNEEEAEMRRINFFEALIRPFCV